MRKTKFDLIPFNPNKDSSPNIAISGSIALDHHKIAIKCLLSGEYEKVKLTPTSPNPQRTDKLWERTCFELFVSGTDRPDYWEYNLSPSRDWAVFSFTDYRQNKTDELSIDNIAINTHLEDGESVCLNALLPLPEALIAQKLQIGVSAVIQDNNDVIYYYALTHPATQADFHDKNSFIITFEQKQ